MASTLTSDQVRTDVERARALLAETEEEFNNGTVGYEKLAAVKQELAFRQGLLEAVTNRETVRREAAEAEAAAKIAEQKRRLKAEADLPVLEKKLMLTENLAAALLDLHDAFPGVHDNPVKYALAVLVDVPRKSSWRPRSRGPRQSPARVLSGSERGQIEALRKEIAAAKEVLAPPASTNGTKKRTKATA
jgi:hypothetical protein